MLRKTLLLAIVAFSPLSTQAAAMSMKACGDKYQEAQKAGSLNGMTWNEFRKANCGDENAAADAGLPSKPQIDESVAGTASSSGAVFPSAVASQHASEKPARARMLTCLDQYKTNKTTGGNANLKWIQKGGGYYSLCNKRLLG